MTTTVEHELRLRSHVKLIQLSSDLPPMRVKYEYEALRGLKTFGLTVRLTATVEGNWWVYEGGLWLIPRCYTTLTVDHRGMDSGFGFELVLEDLDTKTDHHWVKAFEHGTLIYKEKRSERITNVYPSI